MNIEDPKFHKRCYRHWRKKAHLHYKRALQAAFRTRLDFGPAICTRPDNPYEHFAHTAHLAITALNTPYYPEQNRQQLLHLACKAYQRAGSTYEHIYGNRPIKFLSNTLCTETAETYTFDHPLL